jgi:hypothetical protein
MSQYFFASTVQIELGTSDSTVHAELRLAYKHALGGTISYTVTDDNGAEEAFEMCDEFVLTITGVEEETGCENVQAVLQEQARADYAISFTTQDTIEYQEFHID